MHTKWLVFWLRNGRIGSVELTDANRAEMHRTMVVSLIQIDASGTEHWSILGIR